MTSPQTNQPSKIASKPDIDKPDIDAHAAERRTFEAANAQTEKTARESEAVIEKTAEASAEAARANREILQRNAETARYAMSSGLEAGAQSLHSLAETVSRPFGATKANPALAEQSAQNIRAFAEASAALARGAQEASRAWFDLLQGEVRANLQAFDQLANCRSLQEITALHSELSRDTLQRLIAGGEQMTQMSTQAISDASRAIHVNAVSSRA